MMTKQCRLTLVFIASVFVTACSNLSAYSLFSHYSQMTAESRASLVSGAYQNALTQLPEDDGNPLLFDLEQGRLAMLAGDVQQSFDAFQSADEKARRLDSNPDIQISELLNTVGSALTNDNMLTYYPSDYESGFLHLYLALGYLQKMTFKAHW